MINEFIYYLMLIYHYVCVLFYLLCITSFNLFLKSISFSIMITKLLKTVLIQYESFAFSSSINIDKESDLSMLSLYKADVSMKSVAPPLNQKNLFSSCFALSPSSKLSNNFFSNKF